MGKMVLLSVPGRKRGLQAGHADMQTTMLYVDLSGERFRDEAELLEQRLWGTSTKNRYQDEHQTNGDAAEVAAVQD